MSKMLTKETKKRQKQDKERLLRVVKYIDCPYVLQDSPVELQEGYIVSDKETYDVFASFIFKNVGNEPIKSLDIRLSCFHNQNIPYLNIDFKYSCDKLTFGIISSKCKELKLRDSNKRKVILQSETFGSCVYIPIPESYFTRMDIYLTSVEYENGEVEVLNQRITGNNKRYNELDNISKLAYSHVNIYTAAEETFPTKVIPQFGKKTWLCCCGNKNPFEKSACEKCGRDKDWQESAVSGEALEKTKNALIADPTQRVFHNKANYAQNKYLENDKEIQQKIEKYEKAMENIAREERIRERRKLMFIPKLVMCGVAIYLVSSVVQYFINGGGLVGAVVNFIKNMI